MQFRAPRFLTRAFDRLRLWGDKPVWRLKPLTIRRLDVLIALSGAICVGYYFWTGGWLLALQGAVLWLLVLMIVLYFF